MEVGKMKNRLSMVVLQTLMLTQVVFSVNILGREELIDEYMLSL
jgi:hypothetical protein